MSWEAEYSQKLQTADRRFFSSAKRPPLFFARSLLTPKALKGNAQDAEKNPAEHEQAYAGN
jgi:hypothetical protein